MNAFADLHVAFGGAHDPGVRRLGNPWTRSMAGPGGIWAARSEHPDQLAWSTAAQPGWSIWCIGELFAYRSDDQAPLERFLVDVVRGEARPELLDAQAVLIAWDEHRRETHVVTDRMGTTHAYVGGRPGHRALGTFLAAVAGTSDGTLDWEAVTGFCGFGFYPADRTMYQDVRIVRPATWLVLDEAGVVARERRYWDWTFDPDGSASQDDLVDQFAEIWDRVLRSRLGGRRVVLPISGGLDSRTVFAAATSVTDRLATFSYGYGERSSELAIARQVAAARGVRHREIVVRPYLFDRFDEVTDAVEGMQSLSFSRQAGVSQDLRELGDRVVGGHWGDVWFDASSDDPRALVDQAHAKFAKPGRAWLLDTLCAPRLEGRAPDDVLREFLADELARLPDLGDPSAQLRALKTEQWSFRWTLASVRAYQLGAATDLPFYANDVVDFFARVPSSRLVGRRLQVAYLTRHHPELARVRWQQTDLSLFARPGERAALLPRRVVRKVARTMRRNPIPERNWEVQYLRGSGPHELRGHLRRAADLGLGPPGSVDALVTAFLEAPNPARGYAVDVLLTLAPSLT